MIGLEERQRESGRSYTLDGAKLYLSRGEVIPQTGRSYTLDGVKLYLRWGEVIPQTGRSYTSDGA
eukprot:841194-Prorocentrum_minimum.AAC.1